MLVIDDIQQTAGLETFLRRLGFDTLSISREAFVNDALLGFHPEIVIASFLGRNVDGVRLAQRLKKQVPTPRIALSFTGQRPTLTKEDEKAIDALIEIPLQGENAVKLLAQLGGLSVDPLLEKFRKFSKAKLTSEEEVVIVLGGAAPAAAAVSAAVEFDPKKTPGQSAELRSERSNRYDQFLQNNARDLANGAADKVMPRERAAQLMKQLKEDSKTEKDILEEIQKQKLKFAEALFEDDVKRKK